MRVYVTGASGFVGSHVARELRERGAEVRDDFVELGDRAGLERAVDGCDAVFHVAALYSFEAPAAELDRVNVEGTRNVLDACRAQKVRRLVHTSSAATCGPVPGREATEEHSPPHWELSVPYKRTKLQAERLVVRSPIDAVVVNPTTPVGEGNRRPTPTGRMIRRVASGRYRAFLDIGLNVVAAVADLAGRPRPRLRVPYAAVRAAALVGLVNRHEARLARLPAYFSSAKAERDLGYRPGAVEPALARAVADLSGAGGGASGSTGPER